MVPYILIVFITYFFHNSYSLSCFECQGPFEKPCAVTLSVNSTTMCHGKNAQCFESIESYAYDALRLVKRDCYVPIENSTIKDYCTSFNNPCGKLVTCNVCTTDNCNGGKYGSNGFVDTEQYNFTDFHYVGTKNDDARHFREEELYLLQLHQ